MKVVVIDDGGSMAAETSVGAGDHGSDAVVISAAIGRDVRTGEGMSGSLDDCSVVIDLSGPSPLVEGTLTEEFSVVIDDEAVMQRLCRSMSQ